MCQLCNLVNVANRRQVNPAPPTCLSSWGTLSPATTPQSFARQEPDRYDSSPRSQSPGDGSSISS